MLSSTGALEQQSNSCQFDASQYPIHDTGYGGFSAARSELANATALAQDPSRGMRADLLSLPEGSFSTNQILQTVLNGIFQLLNTLLSAVGLGAEPNEMIGGVREPAGSIPPEAKETSRSGGSFLERIPDYVEKGKELWQDGKEVYNQVRDYASDAWDTAVDWANTAWDTAKDWGSAIWDGAKSVYNTGVNWASSIWSWFV